MKWKLHSFHGNGTGKEVDSCIINVSGMMFDYNIVTF